MLIEYRSGLIDGLLPSLLPCDHVTVALEMMVAARGVTLGDPAPAAGGDALWDLLVETAALEGFTVEDFNEFERLASYATS